MTIHHTLFYQDGEKRQLHIYDSREAAIKAAERMIEQFKFWGGGCIPLSVSSSKWRSNGKYAGEAAPEVNYNPADLAYYSRENGNNYGYYQYRRA